MTTHCSECKFADGYHEIGCGGGRVVRGEWDPIGGRPVNRDPAPHTPASVANIIRMLTPQERLRLAALLFDAREHAVAHAVVASAVADDIIEPEAIQ